MTAQKPGETYFRINMEHYVIMSDRYLLEVLLARKRRKEILYLSLADLDGPWEQGLFRCATAASLRNTSAEESAGEARFVSAKGAEVHAERGGGRLRLYGFAENFKDGEDLHFDVTLTGGAQEIITDQGTAESKSLLQSGRTLSMSASGIAALGSVEYIFAPAHSCAVSERARGNRSGKKTWQWAAVSMPAVNSIFTFSSGAPANVSDQYTFFRGRAEKADAVSFTVGSQTDLSGCSLPDLPAGQLKLLPVCQHTERYRLGFYCFSRTRAVGRCYGRIQAESGSEILIRNRTGFSESIISNW